RSDAVEHGRVEPRPRFGRAALGIERRAEPGRRARYEAFDRARIVPGLGEGTGGFACRRAGAQLGDMGRAGIGRVTLRQAARDAESVVAREIAICGMAEDQPLALRR